jgi:hypothetical protein
LEAVIIFRLFSTRSRVYPHHILDALRLKPVSAHQIEPFYPMQPRAFAASVRPKVETRAFVARTFASDRINSCTDATLDRRLPIKIIFIGRHRLYFVFAKLKMFGTE